MSVVARHDTLFHSRLVQGVMAYVREQADWDLTLVHIRDRASPIVWSGDAVISCFLPLRTRKPAVLMWPDRPTRSRVPRVTADNEQIGGLAAEHLSGRYLDRLAVMGYEQTAWSDERCLAFARALDRPVLSLRVPFAPEASAEVEPAVTRWLERQVFPLGVFAVNDTLALEVIRVALRLRLRVPEDVAVLGVDDFEVMCRSCWPALSSVSHPLEQIGATAAGLLHRRLRGLAVPEVTRVPSPGVHTRGSTLVYEHSDPVVAEAARYIAEHLDEGIGVEQVCRALRLSRPTLGRHTAEALGFSPLEMLHRHRMERARELLRVTDLSHIEIAQRCGFKQASHFSQFFRRLEGKTPSGYRRRYR